MKPTAFLGQLDHDRIVAAIREAESRSRGEVRVHVSSQKVDDAQAAARAQFEKLGMTDTAERNGVLIYVAPASPDLRGDRRSRDRRAVRPVVLDRGGGGHAGRLPPRPLHGRPGQGRERTGQALAEKFPRTRGPADRDELSDTVSRTDRDALP